MSDEMVLAPRVATEEMKLAGYSALIHVFEDEMCEPNPEDWGRAYTSMVQAFEAVAWEAARNQVIQELLEKAEGECRQDPETGIRGERRPGEGPVTYGVRLRDAEGAVGWLKSQMEGE